MKNKSDLARDFLTSGDIDKALKIAKGFMLGNKSDLESIRLGYDVSKHKEFYLQIYKSESKIDEIYKKGIEALKRILNVNN